MVSRSARHLFFEGCRLPGARMDLDTEPFDPIAASRERYARHGFRSTAAITAVTTVMRVRQILLRRIDAALEPFELNLSRYEALMLLFFSREGRLPLGLMSERLMSSPASITKAIDHLENLGYARRVPHPDDRRSILAEITQTGREVAGAATKALDEIDYGLSGSLDEGQAELLSDLLQSVRKQAGDY